MRVAEATELLSLAESPGGRRTLIEGSGIDDWTSRKFALSRGADEPGVVGSRTATIRSEDLECVVPEAAVTRKNHPRRNGPLQRLTSSSCLEPALVFFSASATAGCTRPCRKANECQRASS